MLTRGKFEQVLGGLIWLKRKRGIVMIVKFAFIFRYVVDKA